MFLRGFDSHRWAAGLRLHLALLGHTKLRLGEIAQVKKLAPIRASSSPVFYPSRVAIDSEYLSRRISSKTFSLFILESEEKINPSYLMRGQIMPRRSL